MENIHKFYGHGENRTEVLKGITLSLEEGSFTVLLGASGSGKSTLLQILSGLELPDEGHVRYDACDITALSDRQRTEFRKENVGFVFQQYYLLPHMTVGQNVKMAADLVGNKEYSDILSSVGLGPMEKKYPAQLSGGEQQRVSLARALAKRPKVLFLDEPTGALDEATGRQVLDLLLQLHRTYQTTVIMVTHNANIAGLADRIITIGSGRVEKDTANPLPKGAYEIGW